MHIPPRSVLCVSKNVITVLPARNKFHSLQIVLEGGAVPHVLVRQELRATVTVDIVLLNAVVAEMDAPV